MPLHTRLTALVLLLLMLPASVGAVAVSAQVYYTGAMQFQYNAQHTGDYSPVAGPVPPNNQLKWSFISETTLSTSPAVSNGLVYVGSWDVATDRGNIYALYANTGTPKWTYPTEHGVDSSAAVANGVVYMRSEDGTLYALNANTGALKWTYKTGLGSRPAPSSPVVANGVVYVGAEDGNVYAINANTGGLRWTYATGAQIFSSPAVANGIVYAGCTNHKVYAINAYTGALRWTYATGEPIYSSPAVANGIVYIGSYGIDGSLYAIYANSLVSSKYGVLKWRCPLVYGVAGYSSPAVANGVVYVTSYPAAQTGAVSAINANTGKPIWSYPTGIPHSSAAIANGVVYTADVDGTVYALNANTGGLQWTYETGGNLFSSPVIVTGVVYIGGSDSNDYGHFWAIGNRTTTLTSAPSTPTPYAGQSFTIYGTLTSGNGGVPDAPLTLYRCPVTGPFSPLIWTKVATTRTTSGESAGAYSFPVTENTVQTVRYKVVYGGSATLNGATAYTRVTVGQLPT
jgi:outer membrane protein assembly factor BamB